MTRKSHKVSAPVLFKEPVFIEKFIPGGQAIGTMKSGKKAFFWNALPGETVVEFEITKEKSHFLEATAIDIKNPSPHRIAPKDSCYLSTSPWQILSYDYELAQKSTLVEDIFGNNMIARPGHDSSDSRSSTVASAASDYGRRPTESGNRTHGVEQAVVEKISSTNDAYFYRNKMEYSLYWHTEKGIIQPAFHSRGSHRKIPIDGSSLERPEIWQKAQEIIADLNSRGEEARKYQSLLLRCSQDGQVSGGLLENGQPHPIFPNLADTILGYRYSYSPNGFFQINLPVYELALREIKQHIHTDKVLDLYSGVGTIGLSVARDKELTLVESNPAAYAELEKNCQGTGATPVLSKSEEALSFISPNATVILDPPRAGCDKKLLEKLLEVLPPSIIYLSCNPATQARDVTILTETGKYHIATIQPFNFFPRTPHIENLIILER